MEFTLIWYGQELKIPVKNGQTILRAIESQGYSEVTGWCDGDGLCEKCTLYLKAGQVLQNAEANELGNPKNKVILSCQSFVLEPGVVLEHPEIDYLEKEKARRNKRLSEDTSLLETLNRSSNAARSAGAKKELLLYYPDYWFLSNEWAKNLLLFSDGICLLIPAEKQLSVISRHNYLLSGLKEHGLIHILTAEQVITDVLTSKLRDALEKAIESNFFKDVDFYKTSLIHPSRLGFESNYDSANWIYKELKKLNLIGSYNKRSSGYRITDKAYLFILSFLAHLISGAQTSENISVFPISDRPDVVNGLNLLSNEIFHGKSHHADTIMFDLQVVGADLSSMPLDEILAYRSKNHSLYMKYIQTVRQFARNIYGLPSELRKEAFQDRENDITKYSQEIRRASRLAWGKPATFALTVAAAAAPLVTNDPWPASVLGVAAGLTSLLEKPTSSDAVLYTYLFNLPAQK